MSGRVVQQAVIPHSCAPGWRWKPITEGSGLHLVPGGMGGLYGVPPTLHEFPKGTVWACDCGQHWVSRGNTDIDGWMHVGLGWRRERWWERRRRLRAARRGTIRMEETA